MVAALSECLLHLNRRRDGAWRQCYRHGVPVTGLVPVDADGTSGTTVQFLPDPTVATLPRRVDVLTGWPSLAVEVVDERHR